MKVKELIEKLNKISDPEAYVIMFLTKKNGLILSKSDSLLKGEAAEDNGIVWLY